MRYQTVYNLILSENPSISESYKEYLKLALSDGSTDFYYLIRKHHADKMEIEFKVMARMLQDTYENESEHYPKALAMAVSRTLEYCHSNRENKISPFIDVMLQEAKHNTNPQRKEIHMGLILACLESCYQMVYTPQHYEQEQRAHVTEVYADDAEKYYDAQHKWPVYILVEEAQIPLAKLTDFLLEDFQKQVQDPSDLSLNSSLIPYLRDLITQLTAVRKSYPEAYHVTKGLSELQKNLSEVHPFYHYLKEALMKKLANSKEAAQAASPQATSDDNFLMIYHYSSLRRAALRVKVAEEPAATAPNLDSGRHSSTLNI